MISKNENQIEFRPRSYLWFYKTLIVTGAVVLGFMMVLALTRGCDPEITIHVVHSGSVHLSEEDITNK